MCDLLKSRLAGEGGAVSVGSLDLLREVAAYLGRLPVNPGTYHLIRKIDEHLASPHVVVAAREASAAAARACRRVAFQYTASGQVWLDVVVEGETVSIKAPSIVSIPDRLDNRMKRLSEGVVMKLTSAG
jgi:hypothetical protein